MSFESLMDQVKLLASLEIPTDKTEIETWAQEQRDDLAGGMEWVNAVQEALDSVDSVLDDIGGYGADRQQAVEDLDEAKEKLAQARIERKDATRANGFTTEDRERLDEEIGELRSDIEEAEESIVEEDTNLEQAAELGVLMEHLGVSSS